VQIWAELAASQAGATAGVAVKALTKVGDVGLGPERLGPHDLPADGAGMTAEEATDVGRKNAQAMKDFDVKALCGGQV
jgi:hypothetical protein